MCVVCTVLLPGKTVASRVFTLAMGQRDCDLVWPHVCVRHHIVKLTAGVLWCDVVCLKENCVCITTSERVSGFGHLAGFEMLLANIVEEVLSHRFRIFEIFEH